MARIRRLVLDLLKPHEPDIVAFAAAASARDGVDGVNVVLVEIDRDVQNVKMTLEGDSIPIDAVRETIEDLGGTVHSIDEVICGESIVEESDTPQD